MIYPTIINEVTERTAIKNPAIIQKTKRPFAGEISLLKYFMDNPPIMLPRAPNICNIPYSVGPPLNCSLTSIIYNGPTKEDIFISNTNRTSLPIVLCRKINLIPSIKSFL